MTKPHLHTQISYDDEENKQQLYDDDAAASAILALKAAIDASGQLRKVQ